MATCDVKQPQPQDSELSPGFGEGPNRAGLRFLVWPLVALAALIWYEIHTRTTAEAKLTQVTEQAAIPVVSVIHPRSGASAPDLVLPGNMHAFTESAIYARTSGYLKRWYFDIGARVRKGQLLAEIATPEIDQQLRQARAQLATAESNLDLAKITAEREENLLRTDAVSRQERDNAVNAWTASQSIVESNRANVARLEQLQSFEKIYAPFDGVITARSTDVGALIDAGASSPRELFHIGAIDKLRVYVAVPETYSRLAQRGAGADLTLDEYPGQTFHGTLVRNSRSFDPSARTLLVEIDVANSDGKLLPGAYAQVHLRRLEASTSLTIPANTLLFRSEGLCVGLVRGNKVELAHVTVGRDYGSAVEVLGGLQPSDEVILDPSDSLWTGSIVRIRNQGDTAGK